MNRIFDQYATVPRVACQRVLAPDTEKALTAEIISAAIEVHRAVGPGLLETAYQACLCRELALRNLPFRQQVDIAVTYKGVKLDCGYRIDLIVSDKVVVELKSIQEILPVHEAQLLTYLRLSGLRIGLLLNFNTAVLKNGIRRRVL